MSDLEEGPPLSRRLFVYLRGLARFAVFVLLGPFIGWLVGVVGLLARGVPDNFVRDLPLSLALGYGIGAIPAAVAGFIIVVRDILGRPANVVLAGAVGGAVGVVWGLYMANEGGEYVYLAILTFLGSVVATVVCWRVTRGLGRSEATG